MSSDGQGNIIINCQDCDRRLVTIEVGKVTFHGGMIVRCLTCEVCAQKPFRGGMAK